MFGGLLCVATVAVPPLTACSRDADGSGAANAAVEPGAAGQETAAEFAPEPGGEFEEPADSGSAQEDQPGEPPAAEPAVAPTTAVASEGSRENPRDGPGEHFVYANPHVIGDLDPSSAFSSEHIVLQNVYETLTRLTDHDGTTTEQLSGVLAESWTANDDATVWTFTLREGVTFHDGTALTPQAVRDSLHRTIDLGLGAAFILAPIEFMEAVDDRTIRFDLSYPAPLDLIMSANFGVYVISPNAVTQDNAWFNAGNAAGTGPYMLESHDPAVSTRLVRYDDYWGGWSEGQVATVDIRLTEDPVLAQQLIRNSDAHYTFNLPFDVYDSLADRSGVDVVIGPSMISLFGLLNTRRLSPEVREALVLSFPYDEITASLYGGRAVRSRGIVPQAMWGSHPELEIPRTDLEAASRLLDDAGMTDISIIYSYDAGTIEQQQIGEVWKAGLATIGVDLVLEPLTFDARWAKAKADPDGAQDVFVMFWFPTFVSPYDFLYSVFHTEEEPFFNLGYFSNGEFDTLIDEADTLSGTDRYGAIELFRRAQEILVDEHAGVFMLDVPQAQAIRSEFRGFVSNPAYSQVVRFYELHRR